MQESTVGWDPITIYREPGWAVRIFVLYLFLILCLAIARSFKLGWQLWGYQASSSSPFRNMRQAIREGMGSPSAAQFPDKLLRAFEYQWGICSHQVKSMKRTVILTAIYAGAMAALGVSDVFREISYAKATGVGAIAGGVSEMGIVISLGLFVCTLVFAAAIFFEGRLERRKIRWEHIFSARNSSTGGGQDSTVLKP